MSTHQQNQFLFILFDVVVEINVVFLCPVVPETIYLFCNIVVGDTTAPISICYGKKLFVDDEWAYIDKNVDIILIDESILSYKEFKKDIVKWLRCIIEKLRYMIFGISLNKDMRLLHDNDGVRDIVYHYFHGDEVYVYAEYYNYEG